MKTATALIVGGLITLGVAFNASTKIVPKLENTPKQTEHILPVTKSKHYELSLGSRIVYVYGEIGDNADQISKRILYLGETSAPIIILINSPGGSVLSGSEIISAMEAARGPVNTVCVELCASMAAMIHSYGTTRMMLNHSILMYHPATAGAQGEVNKMASRIEFLKRYVDKMNANIARKSGRSLSDFQALWEVEHWVDAEDATAEGFNDAIVFVRGADALRLYPEIQEGFLETKNPTITDFQWK